MAVLGLLSCARAFSSCGKWGPLFIAVRGPLTITASLVAEHRLQTRRLSNCGSQAQPLRGMWDLPRLGFEPVSPALAGRFSTTAPPGKPFFWGFILFLHLVQSPLLFILSISLWMWFSFHRLQNCSSSCFCCLPSGGSGLATPFPRDFGGNFHCSLASRVAVENSVPSWFLILFMWLVFPFWKLKILSLPQCSAIWWGVCFCFYTTGSAE